MPWLSEALSSLARRRARARRDGRAAGRASEVEGGAPYKPAYLDWATLRALRVTMMIPQFRARFRVVALLAELLAGMLAGARTMLLARAAPREGEKVF